MGAALWPARHAGDAAPDDSLYCFRKTAYQSDRSTSPPCGVQAAAKVHWLTPEVTARTLPSANPTIMAAVEKPVGYGGWIGHLLTGLQIAK